MFDRSAVEACYFFWSASYFPLVGNGGASSPVAMLGISLLALACWRIVQMKPQVANRDQAWPSGKAYIYYQSLVSMFKKYLLVLAAMTALLMYVTHANAAVETYAIERYKAVSHHFVNVNGMAWSKGLAFPDGFKPPKEGFWFFAKPARGW